MKRPAIIIVLSMLAAAALAEERTEATPRIRYEYTRGRAYAEAGMNEHRTSSPKIRCAIYTRKSIEEGLDQQFNSLVPSG